MHGMLYWGYGVRSQRAVDTLIEETFLNMIFNFVYFYIYIFMIFIIIVIAFVIIFCKGIMELLEVNVII